MNSYYETHIEDLERILENVLEHIDSTPNGYIVESHNGELVQLSEAMSEDLDKAFDMLYNSENYED